MCSSDLIVTASAAAVASSSREQLARGMPVRSHTAVWKFIRKEREKTGVEFFVPLHPIAEKILSLYNTTDDSKPVFPLGEKKDIYLDVHTLGMVLVISNKLGFHASRHTFGVLMLNEDIPIGSIDRKSTRLNSSHMPKSRMPSSA